MNHDFKEIVGRSPAIVNALRAVEIVAPTDAAVLLCSETGTGKELIARAIHDLSDRRDRPLVRVNCAALPAGLMESELFGHERGAFTGAVSRKIGRFEMADGGTIFLDEIGDLPLNLQAKLLRVLQDGEFERVGASHSLHVRVRVISATNCDLESAVRHGRFRPDLYYRLNVFPIYLPPLRERREDIPILVRHFVRTYARKNDRTIETIASSVMAALEEYPWPGNVRELENVIERAVIMSSGPVLRMDTSRFLRRQQRGADNVPTLDEIQRRHIVKVLQLTGGRVSGNRGAARILGINPSTLESRMKKLGIARRNLVATAAGDRVSKLRNVPEHPTPSDEAGGRMSRTG